MIQRFKDSLARHAFGRRARAVFRTPAVEASGDASGPTVVSQVCRRDLAMYLLAAKSFTRFVPARRQVALDDGSLTPTDRDILAAHFPGIVVATAEGLGSPHCPRGGCWERLLLIAREVQESYVIQLDADTLTLGDPAEVRDAVREGASFTQGTNLGRELIPVTLASRNAARLAGPDAGRVHVQLAAERLLDQLPDAEGRRYVRGSAGFAGFARRSFGTADVEQFSRRMTDLVGASRWAEWGSEQVASNFMVANAPRARVLPIPAYGYLSADWVPGSGRFLHFVGSYRFEGGVYAGLARTVIEELNRGCPASPASTGASDARR